jgi:hypothetical protein
MAFETEYCRDTFAEDLRDLEQAARRGRRQIYDRIDESLALVPERDLEKLRFIMTSLQRDLDGFGGRVLNLLGVLMGVEQTARSHYARIEADELRRVFDLETKQA